MDLYTILLILCAGIAFLFVGLIFGFYINQPRNNSVYKFETDLSGKEYNVKEDDALNLFCDHVGKEPNQRFLKYTQGTTMIKQGFFKLTSHIVWLGKKGTAYPYLTENGKETKFSLKAVFQNILGLDAYGKLKQDVKNQIEDGTINVTVKLEERKLTPDGMKPISNDDLTANTGARFWAMLGKYMAIKNAAQLAMVLAYIGCGVTIGLLLAFFFKMGSPIIITNEAPTGGK